MNEFIPGIEHKADKSKSPAYLSLSLETSNTIQGLKVQIDPMHRETLWNAINELLESMGYSLADSANGAGHSFTLNLKDKDSIPITEVTSHSRYR